MFQKLSEIFSKIPKKKLEKIAQKVEEKIEGKKIDPNTFLIPKKFREIFEIECIKEKPNEFNLVLTEKKDQIPKETQNKNTVLIGFLNSVEVITFPMHEKNMYIEYKRRRWRDKNTGEDYYNTYEFHPKGLKATHELANFLKEADREILDALCFDWESIRYLRKEDLHLV